MGVLTEIRPWRTGDAGALVKYANNRKVWLNLRDAFPHPYTQSSALAFLEMAARTSLRAGPAATVGHQSPRRLPSAG